MQGRGRGVVMVAACAALLGCGGARPLDPRTGAGGGSIEITGQGGQGGQGGQAGSGPGIVPVPPITSTPTECGCTPGAGIDLLACGGDWLPNTLRDAPEAVITPDGSTVVFNRCVYSSATACGTGMFRWKAGEGRSVLARDAWGFAVSADGTRALGTYPAIGGDIPFVTHADGTIERLGLGKSYAHLLSADGSMVVARVELGPSLTTSARWTAAGDLMTLGDLWGGMDYSEPTAINADASVVVGYGNTEAGQEPYLWKSGAGMKSLGTLSSRTVQAVARATSADGTVVVGSSLADNVTAIFRWTEADGMTSIATLFGNHPVGAPTSYFSIWTPPLLLSADGAVAAGTAEGSNPFTPMAFRWTASGGFEGLSTAPASIVRAASADGRRIALASGAPPFDALPYQAYLFEEGKGTRPLADVLAGVELDGMTFGDPIALSGDGQFLVGHATCAGAPAIFRAALPR